MNGDLHTPVPSPNGLYQVMFNLVEMRMSHWIDRPVLVLTITNQPILDLGNSLWSADQVQWSEDSFEVTLDLRRYPGDVPGVQLHLNLQRNLVYINTPYEQVELSIHQVFKWLEGYYRRTKK